MKMRRFQVEGQDVTVHANKAYGAGGRKISVIVHKVGAGWR